MVETNDDELVANHHEMVELVPSLLGEQKDDLHQEMFFATPAGMFENMWAIVLLRDDFDHSVQQWRAHRLRSIAQRSVANEQQDETHEEADGVAEAVDATEAPEPNLDGFLHMCIRLPRGFDVVWPTLR